MKVMRENEEKKSKTCDFRSGVSSTGGKKNESISEFGAEEN